jgi:hypothetical protein
MVPHHGWIECPPYAHDLGALCSQGLGSGQGPPRATVVIKFIRNDCYVIVFMQPIGTGQLRPTRNRFYAKE